VGKLIGETESVFWVDLGYKLSNQKEGSTAGFPEMTGIHLILLLLRVPSGTGLVQRQETEAVVSGMYGTHLKHITHLYLSISNNNIQ